MATCWSWRATGRTLPEPDWSVFNPHLLKRDLCHFLPLTPEVLDGLRIAGRAELGPLLESYGANSDYYPVLDLGAERRRFRRDFARASQPVRRMVQCAGVTQGGPHAPGSEPMPALPGNPRVRARSLGALLRSPTILQPERHRAGAAQPGRGVSLAAVAGHAATNQPPGNWELWLEQANTIAAANGGTAGDADEEFYASLKLHGSTQRATGWPATWLPSVMEWRPGTLPRRRRPRNG